MLEDVSALKLNVLKTIKTQASMKSNYWTTTTTFGDVEVIYEIKNKL